MNANIYIYNNILTWCEFGDGFGSFWNSMLCELTRKKELHSSLNLSGGESVLLIVSNELASFQSNSLIKIHNERVHDIHSFLADTGFRMDLSEDSVDINAEGFLSSSLWGLLITRGLWSLLLLLLGCSFSGDSFLWWHV